MATARRQRGGAQPSAAGREVGAILLFLREVRIAALVLNAARYRALERWLGLGRTEANLVTLVAAATVVDAAQRQSTRLLAPGAPGAADLALGTAVAESALMTLAGRAASGAAPGSVLLTIAVVYKLVGVPGRRAVRGIARSPFRLRKAVMDQAQRLAMAAASAARAPEAASDPGHTNPVAPTPGVTT